MPSRFLFFVLLLATGATADARSGKYKHLFADRWVGGAHGNILYKVHPPKHIKRGTKLPVVIYLHGSAKGGTDNIKQTKVAVPASFVRNMRQRPCILIAPQAPKGMSWIAKSGDSVRSFLDDFLKEVEVADKQRVYLTGFSLGAYGVWNFIAKRPDLFAAAVPLAGEARLQNAPKMKGVAIWIFHGRRDRYVNVSHARAISKELKKHGIEHKYTELAEGHLITHIIFNKPEVHEWLFQQRKKE